MNGENHILLQELCLILDIFICFGIPIGGYALLHKKSVKGMKIFLLGVASFVVSQVCIRLPILQLVLPGMPWFLKMQQNPWLYGLFLGLTAGIFEECARLIFMKAGMHRNLSFPETILFGLGHGGIEAILFLGISCIILMFAPGDTGCAGILTAGLERISAITFHVGASLIVAGGINRKKNMRFTGFAIFLHTILDASSYITVQVFHVGMAALEICLLAVSILTFFIGYFIWAKAPEKGETKLSDAFNEDEVTENAKQVITYLDNGEYEKIQALTREYLQDKLTADILENAVNQVCPDRGEFVEYTSVTVIGQKTDSGDEADVIMAAKYENQNIIYQVAFNTDMQITGFHLK